MSLCTTPVSRECKPGWYAEHRVHVRNIIKHQANVVILGDSIVAGLARYPNVWDDHLRPLNAINCGIRGDLTQNVLWRAEHLSLPDSVRVAVILCGTNNMAHDRPFDIAHGVISSGTRLQEKKPHLHVIVAGILPRGKTPSDLREKIRQTNTHLKDFSCNKPDFSFIEQSSCWTKSTGHLDEKLFYKDNLHLIKPGNKILARQMASAISAALSSWTLRVTTGIPVSTSYPNHAPNSLSQLSSSSCSYRHQQPPAPTYSISNSVNYHRCHRPRLRFRSSPQPVFPPHQSLPTQPVSSPSHPSSPQLPSRRPKSRNHRSMTGSLRCWLMPTFLFIFCVTYLNLWVGDLGIGKQKYVMLFQNNNFSRNFTVYKGSDERFFSADSVYIINNFTGVIQREFYVFHRGDWAGYVAGIRSSSSKHLHEKLDFLRFLVSNLFKRFCLLFYQVLPDIFTLNEGTLKLFYPVIAMLILTIGNWQTEKSTSLYTNKKIVAQIRKYRKLKGRPQILFIAPKVLIIFYILLSYESKHSEKDRFECLKNSKRHFFNENFLNFCKTTNLYFLNQQASAFALSQMKIQNCNKFLHILLLLSGDVELNPGWAQLDENTFSCFKERGLHFIHLNINSVLPKVDELRLIVKKSNAAVIGLTETKLDDSIEVGEIEIEGYSLERCDRNRKGGGVACYVRNDISFNVRENFSNEIENIFVDILLPKTKPILVGIVYRPPDQSGFIESLNEAISDTHSFDNQEVYIMGDLNIDLKGKPPLAKSYKEFCSLHGLTQIIDSPTRITEETSTLIDHIMTNSKEKIKQFGVLDVSLSDHQAIYFTRKALKQKSSSHKYITIRSMKNYSKPLWLDKLKSLQYPDYSNYDDVDTAYADFIEKTSTAISEIAPFKKLCVKASTSEWVDEEVLEGINKRNKLFQKFKMSGLYEDNANYKKARNDVQNLIKNKKRNFFSNKLTENIGKPKELWKTLRKLGVPSKKEQSTSTMSLKKDGEIRFDSKSICKIFKDFFANLSTNLLKDLPAPTNLFGIDSVKKYYLHNTNLQNKIFSLQPTTKEVIQKLLEELNSAKAVGIDNIGGKFLKDGAPILADHITKLCNLSIILSKFPKECKIAKLKPLYKKGSKLEAKNYRPISLLPLVSKIFEKIIHTQTQHFLDVNKILYKFQSGFRQNHSTDTSLSYLNDRILGGLDEGLFTGMILIDLQKAFDTIDHDIFLKKAKCMGFSESAIKWYKSYLEDRYFVVNVAGENSEKASLNCGVPQGSVLGPLIFLMYVNDMVQAVKCDLYLYADDSCLVCRGKDINAIEDTLNRNFNTLCDWFIDNRLSIHFGEDKTKSIIFGSKRRLKDTHTLAIRRGDIEIKQHKEVKYLGCIFDCNTSGEAMALKVLNKVNSRLRFLYRKQAILNGPLRRLLCNALIQPHFDYASQAWYPNLTKTLSIKLQRAQNKCIRFCLNLDNRAHLDKKEFKDINWLPVKERVAQRIRVTAFNFFNGTSPLYMSEIFIPHETVQATRNSKHRFKVPLKKTNMGQNSLSYLGPKLWNDLPSELKLSKSKNIFKHKIKSAYFEDL